MRQIVSTFAQLEKELITSRLRNGRRFKTLDRGIKASGNTPLGYRFEGHGSKHRRVVVDSEEAKTVQNLFKTFLKARSVQETARFLNEQGYANRRGKPFTRHTVRAILLNPFYTGKVSYAGRTVKGQQEPLISAILYSRVKAKLGRGRKR